MNMPITEDCQPAYAQASCARSACLHDCTQRLYHLQAAADQLRRRYPATSQSAIAGGGSSTVASRSAVLDASEGRQERSEEAKEPVARIETANDAARVEPRRTATSTRCRSFRLVPAPSIRSTRAPGQITDIALEPGEQLTGSGPVSAGDTVRWVVGDTESGSGDTRRVHIMVKPTRPSIETNLVVNTDRRTYLIELRSREKPYMPSVAWFYPEDRPGRARAVSPTPVLPDLLSGAIATPSRATIRPGGRSASMTMAARSISSSHPASFRAKCRRCSSSVRTAIPKSSTTEPIVTC